MFSCTKKKSLPLQCYIVYTEAAIFFLSPPFFLFSLFSIVPVQQDSRSCEIQGRKRHFCQHYRRIAVCQCNLLLLHLIPTHHCLQLYALEFTLVFISLLYLVLIMEIHSLFHPCIYKHFVVYACNIYIRCDFFFFCAYDAEYLLHTQTLNAVVQKARLLILFIKKTALTQVVNKYYV